MLNHILPFTPLFFSSGPFTYARSGPSTKYGAGAFFEVIVDN